MIVDIHAKLEGHRLLIEESISRLDIETQQPAGLYAPIAYVLRQPGAKRLRPMLTLLVQDYIRPEVPVEVYPALALELFHNFTLLHDDIMDHSMTRRGNPSVYAKYGLNKALLSGDAMMVMSYTLLSKTDQSLLPKLFDSFSDMAAKIMEGQQLDVDYEVRPYISEEEYLLMIGYKTAVLIATACAFGATLSKASEQEVEAFYQFGWSLGIAFQLQDDYLDLYGEEQTFGKPLGGDILEGKKTILHTLAYSVADANQRVLLQEAMAMSGDAPNQKIDRVRTLFDELKVATLAQHHIVHYLESAREVLSSLEATYGEAMLLGGLIDRISQRNG